MLQSMGSQRVGQDCALNNNNKCPRPQIKRIRIEEGPGARNASVQSTGSENP